MSPLAAEFYEERVAGLESEVSDIKVSQARVETNVSYIAEEVKKLSTNISVSNDKLSEQMKEYHQAFSNRVEKVENSIQGHEKLLEDQKRKSEEASVKREKYQKWLVPIFTGALAIILKEVAVWLFHK